MTLIPKQPRLEDKAHLRSFKNRACMICGDYPSVGAHLRKNTGEGIVGGGRKPDDNKALPLCPPHHDEQHRVGERAFWSKVFAARPDIMFMCLSSYAQLIYIESKNDRKQRLT